MDEKSQKDEDILALIEEIKHPPMEAEYEK
jgi:hypothetical protein